MCAIVGIFGNIDAAKLATAALFEMQHRGHEATGISCGGLDGEKISTVKDMGFVREVFSEKALEQLKGDVAIGHNRYSTAGTDSVSDAQPIHAGYKLGEISIVHNGNLINKDEVRNDLISDGAIFQTNMDTENMIHLIARSKKERLRERIMEALDVVKGAYNFLIQDGGSKMFVVRDKYGIRPLSIGKLRSGGWIISSETCAFDLVDAEFVREVKPGEMLVFAKGFEEPESVQLFAPESRPCAFEYVYLCRPDSDMNGQNVYSTRTEMGRRLAIASKVDADMVVPVPDSGVASALGYARESGIPFELGIIRNHYVGRTFIEPTQAIRDMKVKMKLSPQKSLVAGKKLVVIDDSVVRGTTSKRIVRMLKDAGAAEVHFRVASPEIKFPDYYGIDTPTKEELVSSTMSIEEVRDFIEADSLEFLSVDDLVASIGGGTKDDYSLCSFNGEYFIK